MKKHIRTLVLTGLLSSFCLTPLSNAYAHDYNWREKHYQREQKHSRQHQKRKNRTKQQEKIVHVYHHDDRCAHTRPRKQTVKKVIVHQQAPKKVVHVYEAREREHNHDDTAAILAFALASTALVLALD